MRLLKTKHVVSCVKEYESDVPDVKIIQIPTLWDNYTYLIISGSEAAVVDPADYPPVKKEIIERNCTLKYVLITHHHIDHTGGVLKCKRIFGAQIVGPKDIGNPMVDNYAKESDGISIGNISLTVLSTPGHTKTHVAYYCDTLHALFSGDTIFPCGYGYINKDAEKVMWESLKKIRSLPGNTFIYCAHEYSIGTTSFACELDSDNEDLKRRFLNVKKRTEVRKPTVPTTIKMEKDLNPFLRWDDMNLKEKLGISNMGDFETFLKIRALKNEFNKRN